MCVWDHCPIQTPNYVQVSNCWSEVKFQNLKVVFLLPYSIRFVQCTGNKTGPEHDGATTKLDSWYIDLSPKNLTYIPQKIPNAIMTRFLTLVSSDYKLFLKKASCLSMRLRILSLKVSFLVISLLVSILSAYGNIRLTSLCSWTSQPI